MGTWNLGTKKDIAEFIDAVKQLKEDFYLIVGDDEVLDGLDSAISRAEELKGIAKEERDYSF
jgi:hypothetical protein